MHVGRTQSLHHGPPGAEYVIFLATSGEPDLAQRLLDAAPSARQSFYGIVSLHARALAERATGNPARAEDAANQALALAWRSQCSVMEVECVELLAGVASDLESYKEEVGCLPPLRRGERQGASHAPR
jgi:hypothetical protein